MNKLVPNFLNVSFKNKTAIIDGFGVHSYNDIISQGKILSRSILRYSGVDSKDLQTHPLKNSKVAFLCSNDHTYVTAQWSTWMSGCTAVPLSKYHPLKELEFIIDDCQPKVLVCTEKYAEKLSSVGEKHGVTLLIFQPELKNDCQIKSRNFSNQLLPKRNVSEEDLCSSWEKINWNETDGQIVYTSGTTGRPKGVVSTFANLASQVQDINEAWNVVEDDCYLHVLPLHHVHGIVNNLVSPLSAGASVTMLDEFNAEKVWWHLLEDKNVNVFHAVPTIYAKLIDFYTENFLDRAESIRDVISKKFRLMVSGSASLPVPILKKWEKISGHVLLERYGMTEIGMALTNPLIGKRVEGAVGKPFPSLKFKIIESSKGGRTLVEGDHSTITKYADGDGSLLVKGTSVFKEYLNLEEATKESFDEEGWFITGDTATYDEEFDVLRIMGRTSVDIINSAGYKISALEIEKHILSVEGVKEVAVVALPDDVYGEIVCAIAVPTKSFNLTLKHINEQCKDKMAKYKLPRSLKILDEIPKNAMGKINKKQLVASLRV